MTRVPGPVSCRRVVRVLVALAALPALTGCIDLVPVRPPDETVAALDVFLRTRSPVDAAAPQEPVVVTAVLDPGVADGGSRRPVADPTLIVAGVALEPTGQGPAGRFAYSATITIDPETLLTGAFTVVPPVIGGMEVPAAEIRWPRTTRTGAATDTVAPGTTVRLGLETANRPDAPPPAERRWSATVFGDTHWSSRGGQGPPPTEIEVVTGEFAEPGGRVFAVANIARTIEVRAAGGRQVTRVELGEEVEWVIVVRE